MTQFIADNPLVVHRPKSGPAKKFAAALLLSLSASAFAEVIKVPARLPTADSGILMIVTSNDLLGNTGRKTGFWMEELAVPYRIFTQQGFRIDLASPRGGPAPIDPASLRNLTVEEKAFLADPVAKEKLSKTKPLHEIVESYRAYFVVGGHGVMWDLPGNKNLEDLLSRAFDNGKVVAAVCHGPCALVNVTLPNGKPLVKEKHVTGFSDEEEKAAQMDSVAPFSLEGRLRSAGGLYTSAPLWTPHAIRDGRLVTGQNPASSRQTALETLYALNPPSVHDLMLRMMADIQCLAAPGLCGKFADTLADFRAAALESAKLLRIQYASIPAKLAVVNDMYFELDSLLNQLERTEEDDRRNLLLKLSQLAEKAHSSIFSGR